MFKKKSKTSSASKDKTSSASSSSKTKETEKCGAASTPRPSSQGSSLSGGVTSAPKEPAPVGPGYFYEDTIVIAREDIGDGVHGVGIDFGGTLVKIAYIEASEKNADPVTVLLKSFSTIEIDLALDFVKETILDPMKDVNDPKFVKFACGVGAMLFKDKITSTIGDDLNITDEFKCFANGFLYGLNKMKREDFIAFEGYSASKNFGGTIPGTDMLLGMTLMNLKTEAGKKEAETDNTPLFPCVICFAGSAAAYEIIHRDGSHEAFHLSTRGGMYFYALGKLLTGCKGYAELLELAIKGDSRAISFTAKDFGDNLKQGDIDFTELVADENFDFIGLPFAKIIKNAIDNPSKEDIANTLIQVMCADIISTGMLLARLKGIQRIYFCGSFCKDNPFMAETMKRAALFEMGMEGPLMYISLLKYEGYIGAIGNILRAKQEIKTGEP